MKKVLEVKNLSVGYKDAIVQNISFGVSKGEIVGILGLNGSGKSTLLGGLCGNKKLFGGTVLVNGIQINTLPSKKRARYVSFFTQRTPVTQGLTVRQIIEMGCYCKTADFFSVLPPKNKNETVATCAELVHITHLLEQDITKLSEGQRSLAFLAKTIAQDTPIILLDEPDNHLDYVNTHHLFHTFQTLVENQGKSAVIVLHNPALALNYCSRLMIIKHGKIHGEATLQKDNLATLQTLFRSIYPSILINKDKQTGLYYTMLPKS